MKYTIYGISHKTFVALHDTFMPHTVITSSVWNNDEKLFTVELSSNVTISASNSEVWITLDNSDNAYILVDDDFIGIVIS